MNTKNPFDDCSEQYVRFRPGYPPEMIDFVQSLWSDHPTLLDVGAGTGNAGAPFVLRGADVISIEPSLAMAKQGLRSYPNLRYICSSAEQLPIASGSVEMVVCGQAFHWFDPQPALLEFTRVLKPAGRVCLFWNTRNGDFPQVRLFDDLIHRFNPGHDPAYRDKDWSSILSGNPRLRFEGHHRFQQTVAMTVGDWIGLSRSISYVQSMEPSKRPAFEAALREQLSTLASIDCFYTTDLWIARKTH